jgi:hypothetical protein
LPRKIAPEYNQLPLLPAPRVIATLLLAAAAACTQEDPPPVLIDIDYQVRCLECEPRAADDPVHDVHAAPGADGFQVSCSRDRLDGVSVFSFGADSDAVQSNGVRGYGFEVLEMAIGPDPGSSCSVLLHEGANRYQGRCAAGDPDQDTPCQVTSSIEHGVVRGSLLCVNVPNAATGELRRSVVKSLTRDPAEFQVHGCPSP